MSLNEIVAIAVVNLPIFARLARAQTLAVRRFDFVEAKRAMGFGPVNILFCTLQPNIAAPLIVRARGSSWRRSSPRASVLILK